MAKFRWGHFPSRVLFNMWLLKKLYAFPSSIKLKKDSHGIPDGFRSQACKLKNLYWAGKTDVFCFLGLVHGRAANKLENVHKVHNRYKKPERQKPPFKELTIWFRK